MTLTEKVAVSRQYISAIRNPAKKQYAIRYADYLAGMLDVAPGYTVSYMAAQAVRNHLTKIWWDVA